jgi:hypothetical protein
MKPHAPLFKPCMIQRRKQNAGHKHSLQCGVMIYDMIYIYLTSIWLTPGGSSTAHTYAQTVQIIQRRENWEVRAVPRLCELYPGICLTAGEKARKNLS